MAAAKVKTVGVVGLGLIGASFARAYKEAGCKVLAYDKDSSVILMGKLGGFVDDACVLFEADYDILQSFTRILCECIPRFVDFFVCDQQVFALFTLFNLAGIFIVEIAHNSP